MAIDLGPDGLTLGSTTINDWDDVGGGKVLQVVSSTKTDKQTITSTSMIDVSGLSLSITPTSTSSKILIIANCHGGHDNTNYMLWNIVRNSTAVSASTSGHNYLSMMNSYVGDNVAGGFAIMNLGMNFLDSPNTTNATTYKIQVSTTGGTAVVNGRPGNTNGGTVSTITAMEIAG